MSELHTAWSADMRRWVSCLYLFLAHSRLYCEHSRVGSVVSHVLLVFLAPIRHIVLCVLRICTVPFFVIFGSLVSLTLSIFFVMFGIRIPFVFLAFFTCCCQLVPMFLRFGEGMLVLELLACTACRETHSVFKVKFSPFCHFVTHTTLSDYNKYDAIQKKVLCMYHSVVLHASTQSKNSVTPIGFPMGQTVS